MQGSRSSIATPSAAAASATEVRSTRSRATAISSRSIEQVRMIRGAALAEEQLVVADERGPG